jgi:LysR family transcriptional regulator, glycine cleavage system transcriptional activator
MPPLNPLRAFEAAARQGHLGRAAAELNVTDSAISHQIRVLETSLGVKLFAREGRRIKLTEAGEALVPSLHHAFNIIADVAAQIREPEVEGKLTVSAPPEFAAKWLVRRIDRFLNTHTNVDLTVVTHSSDETELNLEADIAVIYGAGEGDWRERWVAHLDPIDFFPVCSPKLLTGPISLTCPDALAGYRLLHDDDGKAWATWLGRHAPAVVITRKGIRYSDAGLSLEAAVAGHGVALGDHLLAADDLQSGRLVRPFTGTVPALGTYYLVAERRKVGLKKVALFTDFLLKEVKRM